MQPETCRRNFEYNLKLKDELPNLSPCVLRLSVEYPGCPRPHGCSWRQKSSCWRPGRRRMWRRGCRRRGCCSGQSSGGRPRLVGQCCRRCDHSVRAGSKKKIFLKFLHKVWKTCYCVFHCVNTTTRNALFGQIPRKLYKDGQTVVFAWTNLFYTHFDV